MCRRKLFIPINPLFVNFSICSDLLSLVIV